LFKKSHYKFIVFFVVVLAFFANRYLAGNFFQNLVYSATRGPVGFFSKQAIKISRYTFSFFNRSNVLKENDRLRKENVDILSRLAGLEELTRENDFLRKQLDVAPREKQKLLIAKISEINRNNLASTAVIDQGAVNGIKKGMAVISGGNVLVGTVGEVFSDYSTIFFPDDPRAINLIHYNTKEPETLCEQLLKLVEIGGPNLQGFQLNIAWPNPNQLDKFHKAVKRHYSLIFQINERVLEDVKYSPKELSLRICKNSYDDYMDGILIDPSGGKGKLFDIEMAHKFLSEIRDTNYLFGMGIAGGLCADTLHVIEPLLEEFRHLSTDAEGKLRNLPDDTLNVEDAKLYVKRNLEMVDKL